MDKLIEKCKQYDPNEDPSGSIGISLAEQIFQKYGKFNINEILDEQDKASKWKKIAFREFPPLARGEHILAKEIKERLGELKKAGYSIPSGYCKLKKSDAWICLRNARKDISFRLKNSS